MGAGVCVARGGGGGPKTLTSKAAAATASVRGAGVHTLDPPGPGGPARVCSLSAQAQPGSEVYYRIGSSGSVRVFRALPKPSSSRPLIISSVPDMGWGAHALAWPRRWPRPRRPVSCAPTHVVTGRTRPRACATPVLRLCAARSFENYPQGSGPALNRLSAKTLSC